MNVKIINIEKHPSPRPIFMRTFIVILSIFGFCSLGQSQFTIVPTNTTSPIVDLKMDGDTLVISGEYNYLAKSYDLGKSVKVFPPVGDPDYVNNDFQIVNDRYYILSVQGAPYEHNKILRSKDYGHTWETLYDTAGLYLSLEMLDSAFGVMGGSYGNYSMTQGSDTAWKSQSPLYSGIIACESFGDSTLLMLATGSMSYITTNRGDTFEWNSGTANIHNNIQFVNRDTVYAISYEGNIGPRSILYRSFEGGHSWQNVNLTAENSEPNSNHYWRIYDIYFNTTSHGYAIGFDFELDQAIILETHDYGNTWLMQPTGIEEEFYDLLNVNDSIAFIGGANGTLLKWNKLKDTCSVTLSYEPASCSTCCDATINATFNSNCPPYDLSWSPGDPTFPPGSACPDTTYVVTMTDGCGCVATDSITPDSIATGLKSVGSNKGAGFVIYPNPARGGVFIEPNKDHTNGIVRVLDIYGRVVMNKAVHGKRWLDLSQLPQGVFIIKLMDSTNSRLLGSKKLIISRDG